MTAGASSDSPRTCMVQGEDGRTEGGTDREQIGLMMMGRNDSSLTGNLATQFTAVSCARLS